MDVVNCGAAGASQAGGVCHQAQAGQHFRGDSRHCQYTMPVAGAAAAGPAELPTPAACAWVGPKLSVYSTAESHQMMRCCASNDAVLLIK